MEAVIFDLDGVLASTDHYHYESWKFALEAYGIKVNADVKDKLLGLTRRRSLDLLLGEKIMTGEQLDEILKRKNQQYLESIEKIGPRDLAPGISTLLQELHLARIPIGVASASQNVAPVLQHLGIDGFVQAYSDGIRVRRSKPAPDAFLQTAKDLRVDPELCLAIEDSAAGIQAARSAGMIVIGLGPDYRVGGAHMVLDDLSRVQLNDIKEIYARCREIEPTPYRMKEVPQAV